MLVFFMWYIEGYISLKEKVSTLSIDSIDISTDRQPAHPIPIFLAMPLQANKKY